MATATQIFSNMKDLAKIHVTYGEADLTALKAQVVVINQAYKGIYAAEYAGA